jgi:hypothetical protein
MWWDYADFEARDGLSAMAVTRLDGEPQMPTQMMESALTITVRGAIIERSSTGDRLVARVATNGPIFVESVALGDGAAQPRQQYVANDDLIVESATPLMAGSYMVTITGRLVAGYTVDEIVSAPQFSRVIPVEVTAPKTDPAP